VTSLELRRYRLIVQYDGYPFHGWQLQDSGPTVQGELERILEEITGERRPVVGSGRTDRGVHAWGQSAAVDVPSSWSAADLRKSLNAMLQDEIWIEEVRRVSPDFHPRYHPVARSYEYRLGLESRSGSPFHVRWCWDASTAPLNPELLRESAEIIPGRRSFRKFSKSGQPERGEECCVTQAQWAPWGGIGYRFQITSNRYLHHMVRYLVGTMVDVARGRRPLAEMRELLNEPDSYLTTSPPAPPQGLFLSSVEYPPKHLGNYTDIDPQPTEPLN
jgi:tRNA pseudouridine38-40 synthase